MRTPFQIIRRVSPIVMIAVAALPRDGLAQCVQNWAPLSGAGGFVNTLELWDSDGAGPMPSSIVAGKAQGPQYVVRWTGASWTGFGSGPNGPVYALASLPSGGLIAAGDFSTAGGAGASRIARWDGAAWSPMPGITSGIVRALAIMPNGDLVAGGSFIAGPIATIARWDGAAWQPMGTGLNGTVYSLAVLPSGELVAGGSFGTGGVYRLEGDTWRPLGTYNGPTVVSYIQSTVRSLAVMPDGSLVAAGTTNSASPHGVSRWDGSAWTLLGSTMNGVINALEVTANGDIVAGGIFTQIGSVPAFTIARFHAGSWSAMGHTNSGVFSLLARPGGELLVGGNFTTAGGVTAMYAARCAWAPPPQIITPLEPSVICSQGAASFTIAASPSPLTYEWQMRPDSTQAWTSLSTTPSNLPCVGAAWASPPDAPLTTISLVPCPGAARYRVRCVATNACGDPTTSEADLAINSADFNGDGDTGTDQDIEAFFACLGGHCCPACGTADFNGDGDTGTDQDIEAFFRVLGGGTC